ncbi:hypothetical protein HK405_004680 [Cladochytrium tenue]|nr:hypothetical protein HK405_004680 [Cladochytrium tenue]
MADRAAPASGPRRVDISLAAPAATAGGAPSGGLGTSRPWTALCASSKAPPRRHPRGASAPSAPRGGGEPGGDHPAAGTSGGSHVVELARNPQLAGRASAAPRHQSSPHHHDHAHHSQAIATMKMVAAQKGQSAIRYVERYVVASHAPPSARLAARRGSAGSGLILPTYVTLSTSGRPKSAGVFQNVREETVAHSAYWEPVMLASPVSASIVAALRDGGANHAAAAALGKAVDRFGTVSGRSQPSIADHPNSQQQDQQQQQQQQQQLIQQPRLGHPALPASFSNPVGAYNPAAVRSSNQQRSRPSSERAQHDGHQIITGERAAGSGRGRGKPDRLKSGPVVTVVSGPFEEEDPVPAVAASSLMFDRGAVTILLCVMNRLSDSSSVATACAAILDVMAANNHLTLASIFKQDGIRTLLNAIQLAHRDDSPVAPVSTYLSIEPAPITVPKRAKKPAVTASSRSNSRSNLARAQSIGSNTSLAAANSVFSDDSPTVVHTAGGPFRTADTSDVDRKESLIGELLQKYYDPRFLSHLDKMDKTTRSEIIKHLLLLFRKVDSLLSVSGLVSLDINLSEAIEQIIDDAGRMLNCELILLYLVDPETGELIATDDAWMDAKEREVIEEERFPPGTGIAGWVAQTEEMANIKDANANEHFNPDVDARCSGDILDAFSVLCVPVKNRSGELKGVLQAVNKVGAGGGMQPFNHEDECLLQTLGRQAGLIIQNGLIYDQMRRTQKKVEVLLETTRSLGSTLQLDVLVQMIMDAAKELLSADRCTIFLADPKRKYLTTHIQGADFVQEIKIPINTGIAGYVFTSGNSVNIHDAYKDSRFNPEVDRQTGYVTRNILCVPIKNKNGESIGVAQMINRKRGSFDADDEKMLLSFSAQGLVLLALKPPSSKTSSGLLATLASSCPAAVTIEKSYLFKKTEDMLREASEMKNYLSMILQSITNVVITLDGSGRLSHINHPSKMDMEPMLEEMKSEPFDVWLGPENSIFTGDIQRAYSAGSASVIAQDYEFHVLGKIRNVNYTIVQMSTGPSSNAGVVIVLEDISSEKRALMTLGRYMSPALAKQVMAEDGGQLGGKRKKVAILFSDIRSFTTLSESMEPHEVVELLNHHFGDAVNAIMAEQGILDKYIGDAVMAVFGVPFVNPDDSIHACNAALRMRDSVAAFNEVRARDNLKPIKIGIGINTGMVLSGNIGSTKRMEFSCIGDAVNLASRIEGLTKYYNVTVLVSEFTLSEAQGHFATREVDRVVVTGRSRAVAVFELLGRAGDPLSAAVQQGAQLYARGLEMYRRRQFAEAAEVFRHAVEVADDGPSRTLAARCDKFAADPPPPDWNGVYVADSK